MNEEDKLQWEADFTKLGEILQDSAARYHAGDRRGWTEEELTVMRKFGEVRGTGPTAQFLLHEKWRKAILKASDKYDFLNTPVKGTIQ